MDQSFRGTFDQRIDSKGRLSVPAKFRAVLEAEDPRCPENPNPRLVMLYGKHLKGSLHVYTISAMSDIQAGIKRLPRGSRERLRAARMILSASWETEIDKDGRIVLPKERRDQLGLPAAGGDLKLVAMGEYFEIWNAETYAREMEADLEAFLAEQDEDFDPMSLLDGV